MSAPADGRPLVVGLTGGIGSGKSAAGEYFAALGVDVVDADRVSRQIVEPGSEALQRIAAHFGGEILLSNGELNRRALREIIFRDPAEKQWLESLLHPLIGRETARQLDQARSEYVILVSPLLLEGEQHRLTDRVLVIDVPEALQIERTTQRDQSTEKAVRAIMDTQMPRRERLARADDVIRNDRDLSHLRREVESLHHKYSELAQCKNAD